MKSGKASGSDLEDESRHKKQQEKQAELSQVGRCGLLSEREEILGDAIFFSGGILQGRLTAEGHLPSSTLGSWRIKCSISEGPSGWYIPVSITLCMLQLLVVFGLLLEKQIFATKEYMLNILKISSKFLCKSTKVEMPLWM